MWFSNHYSEEEQIKRDIYFEERWGGFRLFVASYAIKKEAFSYPLATYPLALSTAQGTLYKPRTKHLFRIYLIDYSEALTNLL